MSEKGHSAGGLSVQTLLISSASAVVATLAVSQFWQAGTLVFTALVPIVVGVVSEVLRRPAQTITKVAPLVAPRRGPNDTALHDAPEETRRALPEEPDPRDDPFGLREPDRGSFWADRRVRIGLATGLVAFVIGATVVTASELTFGGSAGGGDRRTTLLGGSSSESKDEARETDRRSTTPEEQDPAATATPAPGAAEDPQATPTPEATATPGATPTPAAPADEPPAAEPTPAPTP